MLLATYETEGSQSSNMLQKRLRKMDEDVARFYLDRVASSSNSAQVQPFDVINTYLGRYRYSQLMLSQCRRVLDTRIFGD